MSSDEDTELRDLVVKTLENNGVLGRIKAELRASVFLALEEEGSFKDKIPLVNLKLLDFISSSVGKKIVSLIREFLEFFDMRFTLSVFDPEVSPQSCLSRDELIEEFKLRGVAPTSPLIVELLKSEQQNVSSFTDSMKAQNVLRPMDDQDSNEQDFHPAHSMTDPCYGTGETFKKTEGSNSHYDSSSDMKGKFLNSDDSYNVEHLNEKEMKNSHFEHEQDKTFTLDSGNQHLDGIQKEEKLNTDELSVYDGMVETREKNAVTLCFDNLKGKKVKTIESPALDQDAKKVKADNSSSFTPVYDPFFDDPVFHNSDSIFPSGDNFSQTSKNDSASSQSKLSEEILMCESKSNILGSLVKSMQDSSKTSVYVSGEFDSCIFQNTQSSNAMPFQKGQDRYGKVLNSFDAAGLKLKQDFSRISEQDNEKKQAGVSGASDSDILKSKHDSFVSSGETITKYENPSNSIESSLLESEDDSLSFLKQNDKHEDLLNASNSLDSKEDFLLGCSSKNKQRDLSSPFNSDFFQRSKDMQGSSVAEQISDRSLSSLRDLPALSSKPALPSSEWSFAKSHKKNYIFEQEANNDRASSDIENDSCSEPSAKSSHKSIHHSSNSGKHGRSDSQENTEQSIEEEIEDELSSLSVGDETTNDETLSHLSNGSCDYVETLKVK